MKPLKVLIVEDSKNDAVLLLRYLASAGYDVQSSIVKSSEKMKEALAERDWDIVLSDYTVPGFSGLDALRTLQESGLDIPFIIISGVIGEDTAVEAMRIGVHDYLMKSNLKRLAPAIEREMQNAESRQARRKAEEALRRSEAGLANAQRIAHLGGWDWDIQNNYLVWSEETYKIFGLTRTQFGGTYEAFRNEIYPADRHLVQWAVASAFSKAEPYNIEYRIVRPNGDKRNVWEIGEVTFNKSGQPLRFLGTVQDTTVNKGLEHQLRQAQKLESIGLLAGGIAHDFNNMLTAINGYSDLTLRQLKKDDPLRHNIEEIKKAGERSAALTGQLLAFSRQQVLQPIVVDLNELIGETINMLRRLIGEDIHLTTVLNPNVGRIKIDPGQFSQIFINLAVNARDAMPSGGILTIETSNVLLDTVYTRLHNEMVPGDYVMLAVSDTGKGMSVETQQHLFEPFFTTKAVGQGTGLGLATVYGIVKQSKGNIEVYSEEGSGTTFKIYFPQVIERAVEAKIKTADSAMSVGTETILLVEDEEIVRNLSTEFLEMCGYKVISASNGLEALKICDDNRDLKFDLLMTDVVMPLMGGRELSERLMVKLPDLKILFTSGYSDDAVIRNDVIKSNTNFIQKPFTLDTLANKIQDILDKSK